MALTVLLSCLRNPPYAPLIDHGAPSVSLNYLSKALVNEVDSVLLVVVAEGDTVVSVFADRSSVGILVRHNDGSESSYETASGDYTLNQKWVAEAIRLRKLGLL